MLGIDTPQPALDFPADSVSLTLDLGRGGHAARASVGARPPGRRAGIWRRGGVGPRALEAFSDDGAFAAVGRHRQRRCPRRRRRPSHRGAARSTAAWSQPEGVVGWATSSTSRSCSNGKTSPRSASREPAVRWSIDADGPAFPSLTNSMPANPPPRAAALLLREQRRRSAHAEPLGGLRQLPPRGAERRAHVAARAGSPRYPDQRGRPPRHGLSLSARPIAVRSRTTGGRSTSSRGATDIDQPPVEAAPRRARAVRERGDLHARPAVHRRGARSRGKLRPICARRGKRCSRGSGATRATAVRAKTDSGAAPVAGPSPV